MSVILGAFDWALARIEASAAPALAGWEPHLAGALVPGTSDRRLVLQAFEGEVEETLDGAVDANLVMRVTAFGALRAAIAAADAVRDALAGAPTSVVSVSGASIEWDIAIQRHTASREYTLRLPCLELA